MTEIKKNAYFAKKCVKNGTFEFSAKYRILLRQTKSIKNELAATISTHFDLYFNFRLNELIVNIISSIIIFISHECLYNAAHLSVNNTVLTRFAQLLYLI